MTASEPAAKGKKNVFSFALKLVGEFIVFLIILAILVFLLHTKMQSLLNQETEGIAAKQAELIARNAWERLNSEMEQMSKGAVIVGTGDVPPENLIAAIHRDEPGVSAGIIGLDGNVIAGTPLAEDITRLQVSTTFQGDSWPQYYEGMGLLLTVPVMRGYNVQAVFYKLYTGHAMARILRMNDKENSERVLLCDSVTGRVIVPYDGYGSDEDPLYSRETQSLKGARLLLDELSDRTSAAIYDPDVAPNDILFGAHVPGTRFLVMGYADWNEMFAGIRHIHSLILWVLGLLVLLFSIFTLYFFHHALKHEENEELRLAKEEAERAKDEAERAKDEAVRASRAKSQFLANMSHEIRTPLNSVLGMDEMILRTAKERPVRKYAWNIKSAGETLLAIINDILDFSKIESGKMVIVDTSYSLSSVINDIYNMVKIKAEQKGLEFRIDVDSTLPDGLIGDEVRLRQIVVNVLSNAVKYTESGVVSFSVHGHRVSDDEVRLRFISEDTGIGIREEDQKNLFGQFARLDLERNRNIEGTGLGLSISMQLARMMGGDIEVQSVYGEGSAFTVVLPQRIENPDPIGDFQRRVDAFHEGQETYGGSFIAPKAEILVVDDNEMNLFVVESLLELTEIQVDRCMSGKDCLSLIRQKHYDVIFLDHMMPEMDGIETLQRAKAMEDSLCQDTPFIVLTANALSGMREMFLSKGFSDYLPKPVDSKALERMLRKYLPQEKVLPARRPAAGDSDLEAEGHGKPDANGATEPRERVDASEAKGNQASMMSGPLEMPDSSALESEELEAPQGGWLIDTKVGMLYSGDSEDIYRSFLAMFCQRREEMQAKIRKALAEEQWEEYTAFVHSLKSTALTVGGAKLSERAKALEMAGRTCMDGSAEERAEQIAYIRSNTEITLAMYDSLSEEARERLHVEF